MNIINFLTEHLKILPYNSTHFKLLAHVTEKSITSDMTCSGEHPDNLSRIWTLIILSGLCSLYWFLSLTLCKGKFAVSSCSPVTSQDQVYRGRLLTSLPRIPAKVLLSLTGPYWGMYLCVGRVPIVQCVRCSNWPWFTCPPLKQAVGMWHKNGEIGTFFKGQLDYGASRKFIRIGKTIDACCIPDGLDCLPVFFFSFFLQCH